MQTEALTALFNNRRDGVTAADAARALGVEPARADEILTQMARDPEQDISVDLHDDGTVHYLRGDDSGAKRWRILEERAKLDPALAVEQAREAESLAEQEAMAAHKAAVAGRSSG